MTNSGRFRLATWNIGAGILGASHQEDGKPDLEYHIAVIRKHQPDVVCLQEAHDYAGAGESQTHRLARCAGYPYAESFPVSPSHMGKDAQLALGIMSTSPIRDAKYKPFPNPRLTATGPNGDPWTLADKGYVVATITVAGHDAALLNAHCFPLHYFGAEPTEARFGGMWDMLNADLLSARRRGLAFAAIDLNYEPAEDLLAPALKIDEYRNAFHDTPTTPKGAQQDYLLYDTRVRLLNTTIATTRADHSYCQIDIAL